MLKNIKIGMRLGLGFGLILLLLVCIGIAGYWGTNSVSGTTIKMLRGDARIAEHSARLRADILGLRRYEKDIFINISSSEKVEDYYKKWNEERGKAEARISDLEKAAVLQQDKDIIKSIKNNYEAYTAGFNKVYNSIRDSRIKTTSEANSAIGEYKDNIHGMEKIATEFAQEGNRRMASSESMIKGVMGQTVWIMAGIGLVSVLIGMAATILITTGITSQLNKAVEVSGFLSEGDLTVDVEIKSNDETGLLLSAMKNMAGNLRSIIGNVKSVADSAASAGHHLSSSSEQMSRGVAEQAGRASQIATSSAEMSQTVMDIAKNASNIASSADDTSKIAEEGKGIVDKTVNEVQETARTVSELSQVIASLGDRSRQIGEIVGVINDIADQTNLLALNAAIEAARAGEQGRGFAVVADEVRKLAERTSKATTEISGMINAMQGETERAVSSMEESLKKVELGASLSAQAGDALHRIVGSVNGLQSMVQQIASATEEMSTVAEQIGGDIEVVATVSKETSASSHQIAQASNNLAKLSSDLQTMIKKFKI